MCMPVKYCILLCMLIVFAAGNTKAQSIKEGERICGKWESTDKELDIKVYMHDNEFRAEIIWFSDTDGKPLDYWKDVHNPDPALRDRKILGMSVLSGLKYDADTHTWEDGMVYDSRHGREWNASATIDKKGMLHVRGYWHFKFIGRTMNFVRI
jgi:uncharacterized protein (DUF2147 family)